MGKFCLSGRQSYSILNRADEVKVEYKDRQVLMDFVEKIPHKSIILKVPGVDRNLDDIEIWKMYKEKFSNFFLAVEDLNFGYALAVAGLEWYWDYPITSFYELQKVLEFKPNQVILGTPLFFDLNNVIRIIGENIKIRLILNEVVPNYLVSNNFSSNNIKGIWVRPEDIDLYATIIDVFEFKAENLRIEETLFQIYSEKKSWPDDLGLLIKDLGVSVPNKGIPDELAPCRMNCGQSCLRGGRCKLCEHAFEFARAIEKEYEKRNNISEN